MTSPSRRARAADGLNEINTTVNTMDQGTQQNAASHGLATEAADQAGIGNAQFRDNHQRDDRIVVLNAGRIEQIGAPLDLYHRPAC